MSEVEKPTRENTPVAGLLYNGPRFEKWLLDQGFPLLDAYLALSQTEREDIAYEMQLLKRPEVIPYLKTRLRPLDIEMREEGAPGGVNYRAMGISGRLVYAGVLPDIIDEDTTVRQFMDMVTRMAGAVTDDKQLDVKIIPFLRDARAVAQELRRLKANTNVVLTSMTPLAARSQAILSAIFSLPRLAGILEGKMGDRTWTSPLGTPYDCRLDPITNSPVWIENAAGLADELGSRMKTKIIVLPGSWAMFETVAALMCSRRPYWDVDQLKFDTLPSINAERAYDGYWALPMVDVDFNDLLAVLTKESVEYPPPQNLAGGQRMPEYLHYLIDALLKEKKLPMFPEETAVKAYIDFNLKQAFNKHFEKWTKYRTFADFYDGLKKGIAPVNSYAESCVKCGDRRSGENQNPSFATLTNSSTANGSHLEPRDMNGIVKAQILLATARELGAPVPQVIVYTGVDGAEAYPAMKALNKDVVVYTYGKSRRKSNTLPFEKWSITDGYPAVGDLLYCDAYGEGDEDIQTNQRSKIQAIARRPNFHTVIVKFYPDQTWKFDFQRAKDGTTEVVLPIGLGGLVDMFNEVTVKAPGRLHTPEFYVIATGRRTDPIDRQVSRAKHMEIYTRMTLKAAAMGVANDFREFIYKHGHPVALTPKILALGPEANKPSFLHMARAYLGFGYTDVSGYYGIEKIITTEAPAPRDAGMEFMPDIAALMSTLPNVDIAFTAEEMEHEAPRAEEEGQPSKKRKSTEVQPMQVDAEGAGKEKDYSDSRG